MDILPYLQWTENHQIYDLKSHFDKGTVLFDMLDDIDFVKLIQYQPKI